MDWTLRMKPNEETWNISGWWLKKPFWRIWVRHLGWWLGTQYMKKQDVPNHQADYDFWLSCGVTIIYMVLSHYCCTINHYSHTTMIPASFTNPIPRTFHTPVQRNNMSFFVSGFSTIPYGSFTYLIYNPYL